MSKIFLDKYISLLPSLDLERYAQTPKQDSTAVSKAAPAEQLTQPQDRFIHKEEEALIHKYRSLLG